MLVTGDEACLDHELEPGSSGIVIGQGYRPDVWLVQPDAGPSRLRAVHEDDMAPSVPCRAGETETLMSVDGVVRQVAASGGAKDAKPQRYDQIPTLTLRQLAERYGYGNAKYPVEPGDLDNWRKGYPYSLSYAALQRHLNAFWSGEDLDPETGQPHLVAAAWHCFTLNEWNHKPELSKQFDDRQDTR
ncbi:dATP/dGTP diphosphohydrolase domain-containing protein [Micromonospora sp. A200]|uniref:dATP/dGTP diphosphohydrolase domain-containing protein n=1 Tax=Micromonospora sp. A200 TaxID=2940568 RepID=UPI00247700D4|nr:dATP/dGTP diphosphohydrolase domain-containing protein [Micromonospora sp. A200]